MGKGYRIAKRMMRLGAALIGCATLTSSCASAASYSWQCHAPNGFYDSRDFDIPENTTQMRGEMVIHRIDGPSEWHPYVKAAFVDSSKTGSGCHCNGITAEWFATDPDHFTVDLTSDGHDAPFGRVPYDKPVTFKLYYAHTGVLNLKVGTGDANGGSFSPRRNALHLSCSSADVDFRITDVLPDEPKSPERCPLAAQEGWSTEDIARYCKTGR